MTLQKLYIFKEKNMNNKILRSLMSVLLVLAVVAAMAFSFASCGANETKDPENDTPVVDDSGDDTAADSDSEKVGAKTITVDVVDENGEITTFTISTDEEFLRGALEQEQLIEGEDGPYGLYIKSVNGILADYDVNGAYWALSKDGEYLMTGADTTPIADGEHYELTYTKG